MEQQLSYRTLSIGMRSQWSVLLQSSAVIRCDLSLHHAIRVRYLGRMYFSLLSMTLTDSSPIHRSSCSVSNAMVLMCGASTGSWRRCNWWMYTSILALPFQSWRREKMAKTEKRWISANGCSLFSNCQYQFAYLTPVQVHDRIFWLPPLAISFSQSRTYIDR